VQGRGRIRSTAGHPRREQASLRAAIGIVPQDTVLFNDTICYNIRYGPLGASEDESRGGALAQVDAFHRAPAGGLRAAGRRARAQAFGRREAAGGDRPHHPEGPADPASSTRRPRRSTRTTEREIQSALERWSHDRTALVIAHRLSTVVNADSIIVLDDGAIAEQGTHSEAHRPRTELYAAMWARQRGGRRDRRAAAAHREKPVRISLRAVLQRKLRSSERRSASPGRLPPGLQCVRTIQTRTSSWPGLTGHPFRRGHNRLLPPNWAQTNECRFG
jgi:ATP-binding cassette subfamily B protein